MHTNMVVLVIRTTFNIGRNYSFPEHSQQPVCFLPPSPYCMYAVKYKTKVVSRTEDPWDIAIHQPGTACADSGRLHVKISVKHHWTQLLWHLLRG